MSSSSSPRSRIPQAFIDELLHRTDLVELIDGFIPLKKQGNSFIACCPFHQEKTPSFNVVAKKQFYHCFGCGASGNAISFVMNYLHQSFTLAVDTLALRAGMQVPDQAEKIETAANLYQLLHRVSQFYQQQLKQSVAAIAYLQDRGLTGEIAKHYQLGYAPSGWQTLENQFKSYRKELIQTGMLIESDKGRTYDRYRDRIMFPIHDRHGRIIGFGGRALQEQQKPKYLNSPETVIFQKNRELYGLHHALQHPKISTIVIVEGYLDVIALAQHGINNAVAALGTTTSTYHIQRLSKHAHQLIFCFDGDNAGKNAAWKALENSLPYLNDNLDARFVFLPDSHDPDSLIRAEGYEAFSQRLNKAIPLNQYFLETLSQGIDKQNIAGKSQLINAAKPFLQSMPEGSYKQLLIDEMARATRIESHRMMQLMADSESILSPASTQGIRRSPVRLAIALLLQYPDIYSQSRSLLSMENMDLAEHEILQKILQQLAENPTTNTAMLIELWRDTPHFDSLNKLASWQHDVPEDAIIKEFVDIMHFLHKQNVENKIEQYIAKSRKQGLTVSERIVLQNLLKQRHQMIEKN